MRLNFDKLSDAGKIAVILSIIYVLGFALVFGITYGIPYAVGIIAGCLLTLSTSAVLEV